MNNEYTKYAIKKDMIKGQALKLTLLLKEKIHFTIIIIYNFVNNIYKEEILEFYKKLDDMISMEKKLQAKIICVRNFNASYDTFKTQEHISLLYHDNKPLNTWNRLDKKSRIDYIWITEDLVPDTIYTSTNKVHIFETDHSALTVYFHNTDFFYAKSISKKKKHNNNNLQKKKEIIDNVEISVKNINRIWNVIHDTFKKANEKLPRKKGALQ
ncbi:hypothetical protein C1646_767979 [Rhizophagus diaphanus]|nr:hypothetical protein C1646_767979 [Rhizophagus diaphanus] [Rhizophagus sp. MUCL 43196]